MPVRRPLPAPVVVPRSSYSSPRHDYGIDESISQVGYLSNAVLDDTYDAAVKSKNRDNELIRNTRAAIRPGNTRTGRTTKRYQSLPRRSPSPVIVPPSKAISLGIPSPSSLLSTKINRFLRGSSMPPVGADRTSSISYKSFLVDPPTRPPAISTESNVSYRSFLSDPSISRPLMTRSSVRLSKPYSVPVYRRAIDDDDFEDEDFDDYQSYRRRYRIVRSPPPLTYGDDDAEDVEEDADAEYYDLPRNRGGTYYVNPKPAGVSPLKLSSYDSPYDGSYEADMAEMYDYVPFGPSRHGILDLTPEPSVSSSPLTSLDLPEVTTTTITPHYNLENSLTKTSFANDLLLDSIVTNTAARAREALSSSSLPEYKNASLVLSVEGQAVSEDGQKRYGFHYYPPPIPVKGSTIGLDERILGIQPHNVSPTDSFIGKYLDRLRSLRSDEDRLDRGSVSRYVPPPPTRSPSRYEHETIHMPLHVSGRAHSVPVSSYRSRLADGQSHRVDVYPMAAREVALPSRVTLYTSDKDSNNRLTVLEKINIKAAIIGSRMEADDAAKGKPPRRPRSQFAANKLREFKIQDMERKYK